MQKLGLLAKKNIQGVVFIIPCMIVLLLMMMYPLIQTFIFSFSDITLPRFDLKFTGLKNFLRIFSYAEVPQIVHNTVMWTVGSVFFRVVLGMFTALIVNSNLPGIGFIRIIIIIPWTVPSIVSANSWRWMLSSDFGAINGLLRSWGLGAHAYTWLGNSNTAMYAILLAATWAAYPFVMMMFLSAMQGIPKEYFEAATVDGANAFQRFWHITIPCIKPVLLILLALETMNAINAFDMIFTMTGGGPSGATEIFGLFIYRLGFTNLDFAGASSVSVVLIICALSFFVIYMLLQAAASTKKGIKIK
jgi:multiple sugar transport system permease protein